MRRLLCLLFGHRWRDRWTLEPDAELCVRCYATRPWRHADPVLGSRRHRTPGLLGSGIVCFSRLALTLLMPLSGKAGEGSWLRRDLVVAECAGIAQVEITRPVAGDQSLGSNVGLPPCLAYSLQSSEQRAGCEYGPREGRTRRYGAENLIPSPSFAAAAFLIASAGALFAHYGSKRGGRRLFRRGWWITVMGLAGVLYSLIWWAVASALA